jgi:2-methylcitrate dehydratase PrpD
MSAALAAGHLAGCSAKEFIEGIVAGYEVMVRLGVSLDPAAHYAQGFHPTGTCGTMASAVTAAKILKLNQKAMMNALGIAGSQAAGSMEFLTEGAFTKRLHPGWAAHSGLIAALLAREGFTGPSTILEGKFGFLHAYSPGSNPARILENWGSPYKVMEASIKPHSCCRYKQGPIDGIIKIMREENLQSTDVEKVTLGILEAGFSIVAEPEELKRNPRTVVDAQFSMPFGAALAMIYGRASLDEYVQEKVSSPQIKDIMDRVYCRKDPELEKEFPKKWPASVEIVTKKGDRHVAKIEYPKGDPENPLSWDELIQKFETLVAPIFSSKRVKEIIDRVQSLEKEDNLDTFAALLLG